MIEVECDRTYNFNMNAEELKRRYAAGERDFTKADLPGVRLIGANLARAKLWGANLTGANLIKANLTRTNLCGAKLNEANLRQARLFYTKLYGANLNGACYDDTTKFSRDFNPVSYKMRKV